MLSQQATQPQTQKIQHVWKTRICPHCGAHLEYNFAYGTLDCIKCGEVYGNSD